MADHDPNTADALIEFDAIPWESPAPGLRVKQVLRDNQQIRLVDISKDFVEADWCRSGHIAYVIDGTLEIDFNGNVVEYRAGHGLFIPPGEGCKHKARVPSGKATLFIVEHSPGSVRQHWTIMKKHRAVHPPSQRRLDR